MDGFHSFERGLHWLVNRYAKSMHVTISIAISSPIQMTFSEKRTKLTSQLHVLEFEILVILNKLN